MTTNEIDANRIIVTKSLKPANRSELGQFFTPMHVANYMASWFNVTDKQLNLLDPGAGHGSLSGAFLNRIARIDKAPNKVSVTSYEIDPSLIPHLRKTLNSVGNSLKKNNIDFQSMVINNDFILDIAKNGPNSLFTHAILNPPYKKISSYSEHRLALRKLNIETVNLYSGFLAIVIMLMKKGGEIVAIIPRSFCNGAYFLPFREFLLANSAIKQIHLFESRTDTFNDDDVLQENIIIHLVKGGDQGDVIVSKSTDSKFTDLNHFSIPFDRIVKKEDEKKYLHIPEQDRPELELLPGISFSLKELGINISTGPVVDFRFKEYLKEKLDSVSVPLIYSNHFGSKEIEYPVIGKKPNAIDVNLISQKWLSPNGYYTVTKRFSSKEENQRIVARVINPNKLPGYYIGIENKLNYFNLKKGPLPKVLAYGLAAYLNSSIVDNHFRIFSGHTQVNATDLSQMLYPSEEILNKLGEWAIQKHAFIPTEIDQKLREMLA